jgi:hypothetical protein
LSLLDIHLNACFVQVGLKGEALSLHSLTGSSSVDWFQGYLVSRKQPLTWYKVSIIIPQNPCRSLKKIYVYILL